MLPFLPHFFKWYNNNQVEPNPLFCHDRPHFPTANELGRIKSFSKCFNVLLAKVFHPLRVVDSHSIYLHFCALFFSKENYNHTLDEPSKTLLTNHDGNVTQKVNNTRPFKRNFFCFLYFHSRKQSKNESKKKNHNSVVSHFTKRKVKTS